MLVYQIMKQQMQDELQAILQAYETNMTAGTYESQFNGQNVDGEFVIAYYEQMLAGFPPGSTEYETVNSKLQQFRQQYRTDVQNLIINAMNNGTQIDFGLLGNDFQNKGVSEVELADLQGWAGQEIADLRANGEIEQADKLSGAVFVAEFNVENDGKVAAYYRGDITAGELASWLGTQLDAALESGLTESSEAYREILKQQASALKTARTEGQAQQFENYQNEISGLQNRLTRFAKNLFDKYRESGGVFSSEIDGLIAQNGGDAYKALVALAGERTNAESAYSAIYSNIFSEMGTNPEELQLAEGIAEVQSRLDQLEENGFRGISAEQRTQLENLLEGTGALNRQFIATSGIAFNTTAGQTLLTSLYKDLVSAGVYQQGTGTGENVIGGHPDLIQEAYRKFVAGSGNIDMYGYEFMRGFAEGKFSTGLLSQEARGMFTPEQLNDSFITKEEMFAALDKDPMALANLSQWIDQVNPYALRNLSFPGAPGSAAMTANSMAKTMLDSFAAQYVLEKQGGTMVVQPNGLISTTTNPRAVDGMGLARTVLLPPGPDGKSRMAKAIPLTITSNPTTAGTGAEPTQFPKTIEIFNTGGNPSATNTFMVIAGKDSSYQIPWSVGKIWLEATGYIINDDNYRRSTEEGFGIFVTGEPANRDTMKEMFNNFDNPASQYFIGKTTTGNGLGLINVNENNLSSIRNYGIVGSTNLIDGVVTDILSKGRDQILAQATALAKAEGKEVDRDYINRAAFSMMPYYVKSDNTFTLEMPLLMAHPKITGAFNQWYAGIKPGSGVNVSVPGAIPNTEMFPNYNPASSYNPQFPTDRNPNWKWQPQTSPTSKAPGFDPLKGIGDVIGGVGNFLGEAFKNKPAMVEQKAPPITTAGIKPVTSTPRVTTPSYVTGYTAPPPSKVRTNKATTATTNNAGTGVSVNSGWNTTYNKG